MEDVRRLAANLKESVGFRRRLMLDRGILLGHQVQTIGSAARSVLVAWTDQGVPVGPVAARSRCSSYVETEDKRR
jgi:hypothetical protein